MTIEELLGDKFKQDMSAEEKLALLESLNLADLGSGKYVDKNKFDARESEIAELKKTVKEYQKKEYNSLNDTQKKDLEYQNLMQSNKELQDIINEYKLKETIMDSGFSADECNKIIAASKEGQNTAPIYAEILKNRLEEGIASAKAEMTKKTTPKAPNGNFTGDDENSEKNSAVAMAERLAKSDAPQQMSKKYADAYYIGDVKPQ